MPKLFTRSFEIPLQIPVADFKARVKAYPVQPGKMKTVPFPMKGFLIQQIGESDFEVASEVGSRRAIRAHVSVVERLGDRRVAVRVWQNWRTMILGFLFLGFCWISAIVRWNDITLFGKWMLFIWGALPLATGRISWYFSIRTLRRWLRDGLMAP